MCCGIADDIADGAEVVGEGPKDFGGSDVGEEFVLGVGRPEIMVRDGWTVGVGQVGVVKLNRRLVVFGNENRLGIGCAVAIGIEGFTNPDVVVIVGAMRFKLHLPPARVEWNSAREAEETGSFSVWNPHRIGIKG